MKIECHPKLLILFIVLVAVFGYINLTSAALAPHHFPLNVLTQSVQAAESGGGLVPCGSDLSHLCTTCDFFKLADKVKNFLLFKFVPPIAVFFVVLAGFFILIAGANPKHYATGKKILTDVVWGLVIIFSAWMLTNTALKLLTSKTDVSTSWYKIDCSTSGIGVGGTPGGGQPGPIQPPGQAPGGTGGLCNGSSGSCGGGQLCSQYNSAINQYASGIASANILKSMMFLESSCKTGERSPENACGLMQFQVPTAKAAAQTSYNNCGVTSSEIKDCKWLQDHPIQSICLTAAWLNNIAAGTCGNNIRHVLAGYNGHPDRNSRGKGACELSSGCPGLNCENEKTRVWECPGAYAETKNYVKRNLYCIQHPGF